MTHFAVWAPNKSSVELVVGDTRHGMSKGEDGWWSADVEVSSDVDYGFSVEGGKVLPDPRAPRLPNGVHAPGRTLDRSRFSWTDGGFRAPPLSSALIYELHVGTFSESGTFDGVIDRLDHLLDLGVTHVELMPVNSFPGARGWGYDGVGLFAPHEAYGGPAGLARLVDACHGRGLAVILDVVYNHLGPDGNYLSQFGPYFSDRYHTPWGEAVNLDLPHADEVRRFFVDNALMWLRDYHVDGLRLDAIDTLYDVSAIHLLEELSAAVDDLEAETGRPLVLIAESDLNDPRVVRPREAGGYGIDAQWSDDLHHSLHALLTGERGGYYRDFGRVEHLARALTRAFVYDGVYSPFRGRRHGRPIGDLSGHRFLGYAQTHDQVGNRARGERLCHLVSFERAQIAAAVVFTSPFVPMLFAGEEWAASSPFQFFTSFEDGALGDAVRDGRRREFASFGWEPEDVPDPQAEETFDRSRLDWSERDLEPHRMMLDWYRRLIALRRREPGLMNGRLDPLEVEYSEEKAWVILRRGDLLIAFNLGSETTRIPLPEGEVLLSSKVVVQREESILLPPEVVVIARAS